MFGNQYRIAISGHARSGKNTVASMFQKALNLNDNNSKITAIALPMKKIVEMMFVGIDKECLYGASELRSNIISKDNEYKLDNEYLTYRQALLDLGKLGRKYNPDIWLHYLDRDLNQSNDMLGYIISDVRMCNEFSYLRDNKFCMIRVIRDFDEKINDVSETEQNEIPNSSFDHIICNNCLLDELYHKVEQISKTIQKS